MSEEDLLTIVVDFGNDTTKFILNKKENPIQTKKSNENSQVFENSDITNFDNFEKLSHQIFYDFLKIQPEEYPLYCCLNPNILPKSIEKMTQIFFETFNVPAAYYSNTNRELLYVTGRTTGLVLDCGDGQTTCSSFLDGRKRKSLNDDSTKMTGSFVTKYIVESFKENKISYENAQYLKETYCSFSNDLVKDMKNFTEELIQLPDGNELKLNKNCLLAPELLFNSSICGVSEPGIQDMITKHIELHFIESRRFLWENIILTGGTCNFKGFKTKLSKELNPKVTPIFVEPKDKIGSKLFGGRIISHMSTFQQCWLSKEEYDESGPSFPRIRKIF